MTDICECGRPIHQLYNSSIKRKMCPNCELKQALKKRKDKEYFTSINTKKKYKENTKSRAMKKADKWFSWYIRLKHSILAGNTLVCKDIIHGNYYPIKEIDNGHFISRGNKATRYCEDNCRPQNRSSNRFKGEEHKDIFEAHLLHEIGQERFDKLQELKHTTVYDSVSYYEAIAKEYRIKFKALMKAKGIIKNPFTSKELCLKK